MRYLVVIFNRSDGCVWLALKRFVGAIFRVLWTDQNKLVYYSVLHRNTLSINFNEIIRWTMFYVTNWLNGGQKEVARYWTPRRFCLEPKQRFIPGIGILRNCEMRKVICGIEIAEECWLAKWASNPEPNPNPDPNTNPNPKPFRNFKPNRITENYRET